MILSARHSSNNINLYLKADYSHVVGNTNFFPLLSISASLFLSTIVVLCLQNPASFKNLLSLSHAEIPSCLCRCWDRQWQSIIWRNSWCNLFVCTNWKFSAACRNQFRYQRLTSNIQFSFLYQGSFRFKYQLGVLETIFYAVLKHQFVFGTGLIPGPHHLCLLMSISETNSEGLCFKFIFAAFNTHIN